MTQREKEERIVKLLNSNTDIIKTPSKRLAFLRRLGLLRDEINIAVRFMSDEDIKRLEEKYGYTICAMREYNCTLDELDDQIYGPGEDEE